MGKAIWEFISMVYNSYWDSLYIDNNNTTFRSKVKSKFSPQVKNIQPPANKDKEVVKPSFVSVIPPPYSGQIEQRSQRNFEILQKN